MSTQPYPQQSYPMDTYPEYRQPPTQPPPPPRPKRESRVRTIVGVVVIVVFLVILAIYLYLAFTPKAVVEVRIENSHYSTVEYSLYVDGKLKEEGTIPPGYYADEEITVTVYLSSECENHDFYVIATDIWGSSHTDSTTVELCNGQRTTVELYP